MTFGMTDLNEWNILTTRGRRVRGSAAESNQQADPHDQDAGNDVFEQRFHAGTDRTGSRLERAGKNFISNNLRMVTVPISGTDQSKTDGTAFGFVVQDETFDTIDAWDGRFRAVTGSRETGLEGGVAF